MNVIGPKKAGTILIMEKTVPRCVVFGNDFYNSYVTKFITMANVEKRTYIEKGTWKREIF